MFAAAALFAAAAPALAQEPRPAPAARDQSPAVKVLVVLSRYQGDRKISSLPYTMIVNTEEIRNHSGRTTLRLGAQVPITTLQRQGSDANAPMLPTVVYKDVGTDIDCAVTLQDDGRFKVQLTVEDSSVEGGGQGKPTPANPPLHAFRVSNMLLLRDGQSAEYTTATDQASGDVWKVDVTLAVVK
jgi:hypothetical protein